MATVVSCPGKVLLAGGYLVLDPAHAGLVVATPARFFTVIHRRAAPGVSVTSPQFTDDPLRYTLVAGVLAQEHGRPNPFVHKALQATLALVAAVQPTLPPPALAVTILAQNDFYSQPRSDLAPVPFAHLHVSIANVNKTGLGSSAAMVTSLTAALFLHLTNDTSPSPSTLALIHNLAQYVHSLAQGKVGSGFDVSAAMYGSQRYTRFPVEALGDLLKEGFVPTGEDLLRTLCPAQNSLWLASSSNANTARAPTRIPPCLTLVLADVDAGSNTPSMVGGVMKWKVSNPQVADALWERLDGHNEQLAECFAELERLAIDAPTAYMLQVDKEISMDADAGEVSSFSRTRECILSMRSEMRLMGELSGVPIEPPSQTKLLDAISRLPGVIGAGVPGAGGYDAIWVLVCSPPSSSSASCIDEVVAVLEGWTEMSVRPLSRNAWAVGQGTTGPEGMVIENLSDVEGLAELVSQIVLSSVVLLRFGPEMGALSADAATDAFIAAQVQASTVFGALANRVQELESLNESQRADLNVYRSLLEGHQTTMARDLERLSLERTVGPNDRSFAVCLLDGDGMIFKRELIARGRDGGREAATSLARQIQGFSKMKTGDSQADNTIVMVFLNKAGMMKVMQDLGVANYETFNAFVLGFNSCHPLFLMSDVGPQKEAADAKFRYWTNFYAKLPSSLILAGCGHDGGYSSLLQGLETEGLSDKITLLKGYDDLAFELKRLNYKEVSFEGLFETTKLVVGYHSTPKKGAGSGYVSTGYVSGGGYLSGKESSTPKASTSTATPIVVKESATSIILSSLTPKTKLVLEKKSTPIVVTKKATFAATPPEIKKAGKENAVEPRRMTLPGFKQLDPNKTLSQQKPRPCNANYLTALGCIRPKCKYEHNYVLSSKNLALLRIDAKKSPCYDTLKGKKCPDRQNCVNSHECPQGLSCMWGASCRFSGPTMHPPGWGKGGALASSEEDDYESTSSSE